jgi:hypothetical protein
MVRVNRQAGDDEDRTQVEPLEPLGDLVFEQHAVAGFWRNHPGTNGGSQGLGHAPFIVGGGKGGVETSADIGGEKAFFSVSMTTFAATPKLNSSRPSRRPATPNDHDGPVLNPDGTRWYDVACGPVAAFWRQKYAMQDADQFSFHTVGGIRLLQRLIDSGKRTLFDTEYLA